MREITLDDLIAEVQAREKLIHEPQEVTDMLVTTAFEIVEAAKTGKVKILTDYDADGICSAYIMEHTIRALNPDCDVTVECNDRRGSYGLSPDVQGDGKSRYIILDMGSNQLPLARERLGENVIIVDHHLIENEEIRKAFVGKEAVEYASAYNTCLCNPHAFNKDDSKNAQYCATGLAYRIYEFAKTSQKTLHIEFHSDEKLDNTMLAMACIGTAADMVDVLDTNSFNRKILKDGVEVINKANEENFDFVIGNLLVRCGIGETTTAHELAFNVGSFLNSGGRMSEVIGENGAMRIYNALNGDESLSSTYFEFEALQEINAQRKKIIGDLTEDEAYKNFVYEHRFGDKVNDNIAVYQLPDDVPHALAGLVAGRLAEAVDKAILCVTYSSKTNAYSGSGRNVESNETSLIEFMKIATLDTDGTLEIKYGGHEDALGISYLNNIKALKEKVEKNAFEMTAKPLSEKTVLVISPEELAKPETIEKLKALEPVGTGLSIPPMQVEGAEQYKDKLFIKGREDWKTVRLKDTATKTVYDITDFSYSPESYPQDNSKTVKALCTPSVNRYNGKESIKLMARFDRGFLEERQKELEQTKENKKTPPVNR